MDLNSDVGESFGAWSMGDDAAVLPSVTSANVACGFHAGDPTTARRTCELAVRHQVAVGAHVSYRDLAGFGRRFVDVAPHELADEILYQVGALRALASSVGARVSYVKPHGALYNAVVRHEGQARALVDALRAAGEDLPLVTLPGAAAVQARRAGVRVVLEAFPDRAYTEDGGLVPRRTAGAVLHDPEEIAARAVRMAVAGEVVTASGRPLRLEAETLCVHGDHPGAAATAGAVRRSLEAAGVPVAGFL